MDAAVREFVRRRAKGRCEYCRLKQADAPFAAFHVEHVVAIKHGGGDDVSNLAFSCNRCNYCKGPNIAGVDEKSGKVVPLFHPQQQMWREHFRRRKAFVVGRTPCGRATVAVCRMNDPERVQLRAEARRR
jgi:hypothetical protein